jgi:uncharacterized protein YndB with AHSA1/START domain
MEVTREVELPAAPNEVWEALTDRERLAEWFANDVELDLREGAQGVFRWDNGETRTFVVEDVDPPHRFGFRWTDVDEAESEVLFELEELREGTRVTVRETSCDFSAALGLQALLGSFAIA